jgi:hypothetical protein
MLKRKRNNDRKYDESHIFTFLSSCLHQSSHMVFKMSLSALNRKGQMKKKVVSTPFIFIVRFVNPVLPVPSSPSCHALKLGDGIKDKKGAQLLNSPA